MMHDPWTDRLSAYIDRELAPEMAQQLEAHLVECDVCRTTLAELRAVTAAAAELIDTPPQRDLWPGITARIQQPSAVRAAPADDVVPLRPQRHDRRFSFSMPQLAAAAMLLMALSGSAVWYMAQQAGEPHLVTGAVVQTSGSAPGGVRTVAAQPAEPGYDNDIAALERLLDQSRNQLDPATVEIVERSIESIDRAIADARAAIAADPGNPYLQRHLDNTMRKKIDILQHATNVQRGGS